MSLIAWTLPDLKLKLQTWRLWDQFRDQLSDQECGLLQNLLWDELEAKLDVPLRYFLWDKLLGLGR